MTNVITQVEPPGFLVHLRPVIELIDEQWFAFCQINQDPRLKRTAEGEVVIMPPEGWETSYSRKFAPDNYSAGFGDKKFAGNPAAVCVLPEPRDEG